MLLKIGNTQNKKNNTNTNYIMHKVLKLEDKNLFSQQTLQSFDLSVAKDLQKLIDQNKMKEMAAGGILLKDVLMKDGTKINVWLDWVAKTIKKGVLDVMISKITIFDEIPDDILDRYNLLKNHKLNVKI